MPAILRERSLHYRLAVAHDCWGRRRPVYSFRQHGLWHIAAPGFEIPLDDDEPGESTPDRRRRLAALEATGGLTPTQLATVRALALDGLTLSEVAAREGCSRQAIVARLVGNSKGQGGAIRRVAAILRTALSQTTSAHDTL